MSLFGRILSLVLTMALAPVLAAQERAPVPPPAPEEPGPQGEAVQTPGTPVALDVVALPLEPDNPERRAVGQLHFAGAVRLNSTDPYLGGLSGLSVSSDGAQFLAISDRGTWFAGRFTYDDGDLAGVTALRRAPILDWRGDAVSYGNNDAEGLTITDEQVVVSFEGFHRLWRYNLPDSQYFETVFPQTALAIRQFEGLKSQPDNGGIEALTALPKGGLLAISEQARNTEGHARAWWIRPNETVHLAYPVSDGFRPTEVAALPNGDVVVLERRLSVLGGLAARLRHVPAASLEVGKVMDTETLAAITPPLTVDNMEGLSVIPDGDGYRLFLVSDDNFNVLQRTIVMSFFWRPSK